MLVGLNSRPEDMAVNITKEKKQTNIRSSTSDIAVRLIAAAQLSLEQALDFIERDELVEVTPQWLPPAQAPADGRGAGQGARRRQRLLISDSSVSGSDAQRHIGEAVT